MNQGPDQGGGAAVIARGAGSPMLLMMALTIAGCGGGPLGTLEPVAPFSTAAELQPIYREHMVPLVVIGETVYLPSETCVGPAERYLGGDVEDRRLGAAAENRVTAGAAEDRRLGAAGEERDLGAQGEERQAGGDEEDRDLAGDDENRQAGADTEDRDLAGDDENRNLGADDEDRRLGADQDDRQLAGDVARLECRRLGESAFRILEAQRLQPMIFMGNDLVTSPDGQVRY